ncbi:hypothetical protein ACLB2K_045624 [Fragaria x ananassa]
MDSDPIIRGTVAQNLYIESLAKTSATYAVAIYNLVPAITFILSTLLRLENLAIRTHAGKAKVVGTILGIGGAMVFTFCKGFQIDIWSTNINLLRHYGDKNNNAQAPSSENKDSGSLLLGSFMALASCISFAIWLIIQGIFNSGIAVTLMAWCVKKGGPLFVAVFQPLLLVMVAVAGSLLLDEKLHLGSVLGGLLIVSGLYMVLWGKSEDMNNLKCPLPAPAGLQCQDEQLNTNLLQSKSLHHLLCRT